VSAPERVPTWVAEFGEEWAVPDLIAMAEGIEDMSWHNDVCPSFGLHVPEAGDRYAHTLAIWCDHPEPEESGWGPRGDHPRFTVTYQPDSDLTAVEGVPCAGSDWTGFATEDPAEALRVFVLSLEYVRAEIRRRWWGSAR
jgi:hypothetical protein